jgi:hypothetical protein
MVAVFTQSKVVNLDFDYNLVAFGEGCAIGRREEGDGRTVRVGDSTLAVFVFAVFFPGVFAFFGVGVGSGIAGAGGKQGQAKDQEQGQ